MTLYICRKNCIRFVIILMTHNGQLAHEAASVLVQHLATRVPDKADFRREAADAIVNIMSHMPRQLYLDTVRWFARYIATNLNILLSTYSQGCFVAL